jgi:hypothetical protein
MWYVVKRRILLQYKNKCNLACQKKRRRKLSVWICCVARSSIRSTRTWLYHRYRRNGYNRLHAVTVKVAVVHSVLTSRPLDYISRILYVILVCEITPCCWWVQRPWQPDKTFTTRKVIDAIDAPLWTMCGNGSHFSLVSGLRPSPILFFLRSILASFLSLACFSVRLQTTEGEFLSSSSELEEDTSVSSGPHKKQRDLYASTSLGSGWPYEILRSIARASV